MKRNFVHLSVERDMALQVGKRHGGAAVILTVDAAAMLLDGCCFYRAT